MSGCEYTLNRRDILVAVDDGWTRFALEAGSEDLLPERVLKRSIWEFVSDPHLRLLQAELLRKARMTRTPLRLPFRCDSPTAKRWMEMKILGSSGGDVTVTTSVVREEPRSRASIPESVSVDAATTTQVLNMCGWCNAVQLDEGPWQEVEDLLGTRPDWPDVHCRVEVHHCLCRQCDRRLVDAAAP